VHAPVIVFDDAAWLIASVQRDGGMIPGMSYTAFADVTLPRVADGTYRIIVSTDATKKVHERFDEGDNVTVSAGTTEFRHADLRVSAISAPDQQLTGYPVEVPLTWTVTNAGQRPTVPAAWQEKKKKKRCFSCSLLPLLLLLLRS